ncbi:diguanylate cyclase [Terriglobus sp.]|uniref:GGDEF domain-containing protein n=1 Tax=Terriglobus sp. TaxID=1889013 RepID=UPI003B008563
MPYRILKPPPHWLDLQQVEEEADRLIAGRNLTLCFPAALETVFNEERSGRRQTHLLRMGLLALVVFDMFLVGDYLLVPEHLWRAVAVRLGVITPLALGCLYVLRSRPVRVTAQEIGSSLLSVLGAAALLFLHHGTGPMAPMEAEAAMLMMLLTLNTLLRPDFRFAIVGTSCCCLMYQMWVLPNGSLPLHERLDASGEVFWFSVLSLLANYALSRESRFSWLLQMRGRIQRQMLAEANRELLNQSLSDPLTGVPNRAAYDKRLPELWQEAIDGRDSIAAVMVDVDYFKLINDTFGHLYGDRVLQRIANLLEQAMRAEMDFVARYGGEEFVVLLPGSTLESGVQVAERIRKLVEVAGSPAVSRGDAPLPSGVKWSTVSCGVAAITPTENDDARTLIDAADAALYLAKQSGRNRVCVTGTLTLVQSA